MEGVEQLYYDYSQGKISLQDFQMRLEPILGSYEFLSKEDEEFIKRTINDLELIIYTIPDELQKTKVDSIYPEILNYFKIKELENY